MTKEEMRARVLAFFGGDEAKARLWWRTDNPMLGGSSPEFMWALHRDKLIRFVEVTQFCRVLSGAGEEGSK